MNTELIARARSLRNHYLGKTEAFRDIVSDVIDELTAALEAAQPAVGPAGHFIPKTTNAFGKVTEWDQVKSPHGTALYTHPAPQVPVGEPVHEYVIELPDGDTRETKVWWSERKATGNGYSHHLSISVSETPSTVPAPQVPMTDKEIAGAWISIPDPVALGGKFNGSDAVRDFVRAIEAHFKIGVKP